MPSSLRRRCRSGAPAALLACRGGSEAAPAASIALLQDGRSAAANKGGNIGWMLARLYAVDRASGQAKSAVQIARQIARQVARLKGPILEIAILPSA